MSAFPLAPACSGNPLSQRTDTILCFNIPTLLLLLMGSPPPLNGMRGATRLSFFMHAGYQRCFCPFLDKGMEAGDVMARRNGLQGGAIGPAMHGPHGRNAGEKRIPAAAQAGLAARRAWGAAILRRPARACGHSVKQRAGVGMRGMGEQARRRRFFPQCVQGT